MQRHKLKIMQQREYTHTKTEPVFFKHKNMNNNFKRVQQHIAQLISQQTQIYPGYFQKNMLWGQTDKTC